MHYLISHGDRLLGADPIHTDKGQDQIIALIDRLPEGITKLVVGTGARFQEIHQIVTSRNPALAQLPMRYSPFCGTADGLDPPDTIVLANGAECKLGEDYIGIGDNCGFNPWEFITGQPVGTLFCAGGELLIALGLKDIYAKGHLYGLDPESKTGKMLA